MYNLLPPQYDIINVLGHIHDYPGTHITCRLEKSFIQSKYANLL